jgi:hypothetical protein
MAILEIARIQLRRGRENVDGVPTLAPGEIGWAQDTENLWIGKSTDEGAADNFNTRILTEKDLNIFSGIITSSTYQYQGNVPGYTIGGSIGRTIQDKLNDSVTVFDFGAINDTTTPTAIQMQSTIDQLYLDGLINGSIVENSSRVVIKIPAGNYAIENTLYVPPYVTLQGDGAGRTVLTLTTSSASLIQFCDGSSTIGGYVIYQDGQTNIQPTTFPRHITIQGMTLQYDTSTVTTSTLSLLRADCAQNSSLIDVEFVGNYQAGTSQLSNSNYSGLEIRGQGALTTKGLTVNRCVFRNLYYGVKSEYDTKDTVLVDNDFVNLNRGIVYAESLAAGNLTGPVRSRIEINRFENIEREAVFVGTNTNVTPTYHISRHNTFKEVGNDINGDLNPITSVINWQTLGNVSVDDRFSRYDEINNTSTAVTVPTSWTVTGKAYLDNHSVYQSAVTSSTTTVTLVKLPFNGIEQQIRMDYNLIKPLSNIARQGHLTVNASVLSGSPAAWVTDRYRYVGDNDGGLVFSASLSTSTRTVSIRYVSSNDQGTISYKFSQLQ